MNSCAATSTTTTGSPPQTPRPHSSSQPPAHKNPAADVNDDRHITSFDALMILQAVAGGGDL
ncbi:MAG: hypothetical protein U9Q68_01105 [Euryarchaeota archaeon]|nr:hypothetical protein [Euryarchaeota archaeon]